MKIISSYSESNQHQSVLLCLCFTSWCLFLCFIVVVLSSVWSVFYSWSHWMMAKLILHIILFYKTPNIFNRCLKWSNFCVMVGKPKKKNINKYIYTIREQNVGWGCFQLAWLWRLILTFSVVNKNINIIRCKSADKCCFNIKPDFSVRFRKPSVRRVSAQEVGVPAVLAQFDHHVVEDVSRLVVVVRVERLYPACDNKNKKTQITSTC